MLALTLVACASAAVLGYCLQAVWQRRSREKALRKSTQAALRGTNGLEEEALAVSGRLAAKVIVDLRAESRRCSFGDGRARASSTLGRIGMTRLITLLRPAGLEGVVSEEGLASARIRQALIGAAVGGVCGALLSPELAFLQAFVGIVAGWSLAGWVLKKEVEARSEQVERHLSEMIEVVSLGLRSGLSFERSFALYERYFDNVLAHATAQVSSQWSMGLMSREDALRYLAREYDSALFARVIESMIRSLRFGTSLADALESSAVEARALHKACMEERIAKAPVKMMLPVGALVLPAMLLLVLGPVLLELVQGF